jgi:WD40 repeat protein
VLGLASFVYAGASVPATLGFAGPDCTIHVWEVLTGKEIATFRGHTGTINAFAFTSDGKTLASASADTTVLVWDLGANLTRNSP